MKRRCLLGLGATLLLVGCLGDRAHAQHYDPPAGPTLSPWLNLYQRNTGPLDPYHTFVRPELRLRDTLQQYDTRLRLQNADVQTLGQQVSRIERQPTVAPTGVGGTFMEYSHFYPAKGPTGLAPAISARSSRVPFPTSQALSGKMH